tara:strand:+ start:134 stop:268 length:135 start_codon:yes stop_codon:yes gene_type:complete
MYNETRGRMMFGILKRLLKWLIEEEGMTWERYHRNMGKRKGDGK